MTDPVGRAKRDDLTPTALFAAIGVRGAIAGALALAVAITLVVARPESSAPSDTVGVVPEETTTTLLEFIPDTDPPDPTAEPTVPREFLFGGDPCAALVVEDFTVVIDGRGRGQLIDAAPLSDDTCGFVVVVAGQEYNISLQALDAGAFGRPPAADEVRTAISGIGLAAYGVAIDGDYSVWVKVDNGYFVVIAPDATTARHLAAAAAQRADDPSPIPPPTSTATTTTTSTVAPTSVTTTTVAG